MNNVTMCRDGCAGGGMSPLLCPGWRRREHTKCSAQFLPIWIWDILPGTRGDNGMAASGHQMV